MYTVYDILKKWHEEFSHVTKAFKCFSIVFYPILTIESKNDNPNIFSQACKKSLYVVLLETVE